VRTPSPSRNDRAWQQRLARDRRLLLERLDPEQLEVVRGVQQIADEQSALEFLVVFGSVARGEQGPASDIDIYYEARDLPEPFNRIDPDHRFQVFGMPSGALLAALRNGQPFSFDVIRDALVVADAGRFREALIAVDEEDLATRDEEAGQPAVGGGSAAGSES